jgi:hypothetical protein
MKQFSEWFEAEEWAKAADVSLEFTGTYTGDESVLITNGSKALWKRVAEVEAVGEHRTELLNITEYIVVTTLPDGCSDIFHADNLEDAERELETE